MQDLSSWFPYAEDLIALIHPKHFYFASWPLDGGYYDQPFRLMQILSAMREHYIRLASNEQKKEMNKIKMKR